MKNLEKVCNCCSRPTEFSRISGKISASEGFSMTYDSSYNEGLGMKGSLARVVESFNKLISCEPVIITYEILCKDCSTVLASGISDVQGVFLQAK